MNSKALEIYQNIVDDIRVGNLSIDDKIPTGAVLAEKFETPLSNAHIAVKELEKRGLVVRKRRIGTFVARYAEEADRINLPDSNPVIHILFSLKQPKKIHWDDNTLKGIEDVLREKDYSVIFKTLPYSLDKEKISTLISELHSENSSGLVIFPDYSDDARILMENLELIYFNYRKPVFVLDRGEYQQLKKIPVNTLGFDWYADGICAGELARENCINEVIFLAGQHETPHRWEKERYDGLNFGFNFSSERAVDLPYEMSTDKVFESIKKSSGKVLVVTANNVFAGRLLDQCGQHGLCCPADFQILSFDNDPEYLGYNISTIANSLYEVGIKLGQMVVASDYTESGSSVKARITAGLISRSTFIAAAGKESTEKARPVVETAVS
ncbi:MAG: GntR family transcriptional regulator [Planctomycetota bacterium]|jgi:DNA-binding LacI/PurR family transcriptional regulator